MDTCNVSLTLNVNYNQTLFLLLCVNITNGAGGGDVLKKHPSLLIFWGVGGVGVETEDASH